MIASLSQPQPRRPFLKTLAATSLATLVAPGALQAQSSTKLKAVVIGHTGRGDYGHGLEKIFANRPDIELVGLADPDPAGRAKVAGQIGAPRSYADYREMLAKERPHLVSLAMRHADQHHVIGLDALRAGAHVYSEKPFTCTPAESDDLLAEAERRGLKIGVHHTLRIAPELVALKRAVAEGLIGEVLEARAFGKQDARAGGEDMMVLGTHLFDLLRMFLGDPVWCAARVLWQGRDITPADARLVKDNVGLVAGDQVFAQFAFSKGVNASFTSVSKLRETVGNWGIEFFGSKGAVKINCDVPPNVFMRRSTAWSREGRTDVWEPFDPAAVKSAAANNPGPVGDWLDAIARNREPECSGRNGAWAVEMVIAVYQAALSGSRVSFPLKVRTHPLAG